MVQICYHNYTSMFQLTNEGNYVSFFEINLIEECAKNAFGIFCISQKGGKCQK